MKGSLGMEVFFNWMEKEMESNGLSVDSHHDCNDFTNHLIELYETDKEV